MQFFLVKWRIPVSDVQHCINKLIGVCDEECGLQNNVQNENNLFDIFHSNLMRIEIL